MTRPTLMQTVLVLSCASVVEVVGCGDTRMYILDPGHIDTDSIEAPTCFDGAVVELARYSSRCGRMSAKSLTGVVGEGVEFDGAATSTLESPCGGDMSPAIDVSIESSSLLFDFSNVLGAGRFPEDEFDGYVFDIALMPDHSLLLAASVNKTLSTLALQDDDVYFDRDRIEVNFEGIHYDQDAFLKIDLLFARVSPVSPKVSNE